MLALNILEIRDFMNQLLAGTTFDHFLLKEAVIQSDITWSLDGKLTQDFYSSEELALEGLTGLIFLPFEKVRSRCFDLIKGKRTPSYFKFILLLSPDNLARTVETAHTSFSAEDVTGMFWNIKFQNGQLILTTGVSYRIFSTDKSLEHEWDSMTKRFFHNHAISYEEL